MAHPLQSQVAGQRQRTSLLEFGLIAALLCSSTLGWLGLCVLFERHEAWDCGAYFVVLLPLLTIVAALTSWRRPLRAWRWPAALAAGQLLGLGITTGSAPTLGPLSLVGMSVLCAPFFFAAAIAAKRGRAR